MVELKLCEICGRKCKSENMLCYKHNPESKDKLKQAQKRYRQSEHGKNKIHQAYERHKILERVFILDVR